MDTETVDIEIPGAEATETAPTATATEDTGGAGEDSAQSSETSAGGEAGASTSTQQISGKTVREAVRAAAEALPEHAKLFKQLAETHFRVETAYKQAFATPAEAQNARQLLETLGGVDGLGQLQSRIQGYDDQEAGLEAGDPAVLDSFFEDYPEGAATLAPHYLERLAGTNPAALQAAVAPYAIALLENAGVSRHLESILAETDPARAKAATQQLAQWLAGQKQAIGQMDRGAAKVPGADRLAKDREALQNEREELFKSGVSERVTAAAKPALAAEVDRYAKQYGLNDVQKQHFQETLQAKVVAEMNADANYKKQVDLRYSNKSRTHDSVASYIAGEFSRRVKEKAFEVVKGIYGAPKNGATTQTTGQVKANQPVRSATGGPLFVSQRPPDSELDLARPGADMDLIRGRAYTKGGRYITWRRPS